MIQLIGPVASAALSEERLPNFTARFEDTSSRAAVKTAVVHPKRAPKLIDAMDDCP